MVACAAAAIALVRSPVVHVLAAGCEVTEGWADRALDHFADLSVGAVAPLVLRADRREQVLAAGIDYHAGGARRLRVDEAASGSPTPGRRGVRRLFAGRLLPPLGPGSGRRLGRRDRAANWPTSNWPGPCTGPAIARCWSRPPRFTPAIRCRATQAAFRAGALCRAPVLAQCRVGRLAKSLAAHAWLVGWDTLAHACRTRACCARLAGALGAMTTSDILSATGRVPGQPCRADVHAESGRAASLRLAETAAFADRPAGGHRGRPDGRQRPRGRPPRA